MRLPVRSRSGTRARARPGSRGERHAATSRAHRLSLFHPRCAPGQRQVVHEHDAVQAVERPALGLWSSLPSRSHSSTKHGLCAFARGSKTSMRRTRGLTPVLDARVGRPVGQHARQRGLAAPLCPRRWPRARGERARGERGGHPPARAPNRRGRATPPELRLVARLFRNDEKKKKAPKPSHDDAQPRRRGPGQRAGERRRGGGGHRAPRACRWRGAAFGRARRGARRGRDPRQARTRAPVRPADARWACRARRWTRSRARPAALVLAGAVDADAMVGELIAARRERRGRSGARRARRGRTPRHGVSADAARRRRTRTPLPRRARRRPRVAGRPWWPAEPDLGERVWAGPAHPLARSRGPRRGGVHDGRRRRAGDGPDSAAALSRAAARRGARRGCPGGALRPTAGAARHRLAQRCTRGSCAWRAGGRPPPAAELVADCLPWYRGYRVRRAARRRARRRATPGSRPRAQMSRTRWRERFPAVFFETERPDAVTLASAAARAAEARPAERETRKGAFPEAGPG